MSSPVKVTIAGLAQKVRHQKVDMETAVKNLSATKTEWETRLNHLLINVETLEKFLGNKKEAESLDLKKMAKEITIALKKLEKEIKKQQGEINEYEVSSAKMKSDFPLCIVKKNKADQEALRQETATNLKTIDDLKQNLQKMIGAAEQAIRVPKERMVRCNNQLGVTCLPDDLETAIKKQEKNNREFTQIGKTVDSQPTVTPQVEERTLLLYRRCQEGCQILAPTVRRLRPEAVDDQDRQLVAKTRA